MCVLLVNFSFVIYERENDILSLIGKIKFAMPRITIIFLFFVGGANMFAVDGSNQKLQTSKNVSTSYFSVKLLSFSLQFPTTLHV